MSNQDEKAARPAGPLRDVLEAILHCRYKAYLKLQGEMGTKTDYDSLCDELRETVKIEATEKIHRSCQDGELPLAVRVSSSILRDGKPFLLAPVLPTDLGPLHIDRLKRVAGFSKLGDFHYVPVLFVERTTAGHVEKLLLESIGHLLTPLQGKPPSQALVYFGQEGHQATVRLSSDCGKGRKILDDIHQLHRGSSAPQLILNDHCQRCEFRDRCRQQAIAEDNLSLLRGIGPRELKHYAKKGILTIKQLAYTFRPRRKGKRAQKRTPHYHALQAKAVQDNTVYVFGKPEVPASPVEVYLDVEGDAYAGRVYLIGMIVNDRGSEKHYSFWADTEEQEMQIFRQFMDVLGQYDDFDLFTYGGYEKTFLKRMRQRAKAKKPVDRVIARIVNVLAIIYSHIYFPVYSNGLKDIGRLLGCQWKAPESSGLQSVVWRSRWEANHAEDGKRILLEYNLADCAALKKVTEVVRTLARAFGEGHPVAIEGNDGITVSTVQEDDRPKFDWKWGTVNFFHSDFEYINKCAYFDYQRQRVFIRTNKAVKRQMRAKKGKGNLHLKITRHFTILKSKCPLCKKSAVKSISSEERKTDCQVPRTKRAYNLAFTPSSIKRAVFAYHTAVHQCTACGHEFVPEEHLRIDRHYHGLKSFAMYLHVAHRLSLETVGKVVEELFGLHVSVPDIHMFKSLMARYYRHSYRKILERLLSGHLIHGDETEMQVKEQSGYVWVLANMEEVYYMYKPNREGAFLKDLLGSFGGVLVSDFYSAYDSLPCEQQKCLIHLIQDMNQLLLANPYDSDLQLVTEPFGRLLRSIVETVDQHGLKRWALRRHDRDVADFFRSTVAVPLSSEVAITLRDRLLRCRDKLFTFIKHDGIPWNNNSAENVIKRFAYYREQVPKQLKVGGLVDYLVLLSVCETCRYKGVSFLRFMLSGFKDIETFCRTRGRRHHDDSTIEMYPKGFVPAGIAYLRKHFGRGRSVNEQNSDDERG